MNNSVMNVYYLANFLLLLVCCSHALYTYCHAYGWEDDVFTELLSCECILFKVNIHINLCSYLNAYSLKLTTSTLICAAGPL